MDYDNQKNNMLDMIWSQYVQIYTDIIYSSLYAEKLRSKQSGVYFWVIYTCTVLPSILTIILKTCKMPDWILYLCCALIFSLPIILKKYKQEWVFTFFGIHEGKIKQLIELNIRLEQYRDRLLCLYLKAEGSTFGAASYNKYAADYNNLSNEYKNDVAKHDELTGVIDEEVEAETQKKVQEIIQNKNFYGRQ